ncbi:MAG: GAF domain-containing protein [Rhizomicrobium sp.]
MFQSRAIDAENKPELYRELAQQLEALLASERDPIANAANAASLIFHALPDINWAGFYFLREGGELVLGPFQGKPACVRIGAGEGVCGAAALRRETLLVEDVAAFPGHIACDTDSRSEIVVPLIADDAIIGVLDVDSPRTRRFDADDKAGLVRAAEIYVNSTYG